MRDSHEGMPEILQVIEENGFGFVLLELEMEGQKRRHRFTVTREGFSAIKSLPNIRPFDQMPGVPYRYFFVIGVRSLPSGKPGMRVRVELGRASKEVDVEAPLDLIANLEWFRKLENCSAAEHLAV